MKIINILWLLFLTTSCLKKNEPIILSSNSIVVVEKKSRLLLNDEIKNWLIKDIYKDTIPGISLLKAGSELLHKTSGDTVIVALIDMPLDIDHDMLKKHIWTNNGEISNNKIDDDNNGYIDDTHGWNFLGNSDGQNIVFMNYEYTRILKANKDIESENSTDSTFIYQYNRAEKVYHERMEYAQQAFENAKRSDSFYFSVKNKLLSYITEQEISIEKLDSLSTSNSENENLTSAIDMYKMFIDEEIDDAYIYEGTLMANQRLNVLLNLNYNDRKVIGDNVDEITDRGYGNNMVAHNLELMNHATLMAGIVVSSFGQKDLEGIMGKIKIMPLCVSGFGDENDKDIALAIRYAVDNGASVINISSGKYFSMHENWVHDAIKYADSKGVLIVASSGNNGLDLDSKKTFKYPNDRGLSNNSEISNNFIRVGSSNYRLDSTLVHSATNYGKTEVDIFAPGEEIYTSSAKKEKYTFTSGSSASAAVVSKTAAILKSYYPDLNASQLKDILLRTGVKYNISVQMNDSLNKKTALAFNELSKSGKIVNLYNALQFAEVLTSNNRN